VQPKIGELINLLQNLRNLDQLNEVTRFHSFWQKNLPMHPSATYGKLQSRRKTVRRVKHLPAVVDVYPGLLPQVLRRKRRLEAQPFERDHSHLSMALPMLMTHLMRSMKLGKVLGMQLLKLIRELVNHKSLNLRQNLRKLLRRAEHPQSRRLQPLAGVELEKHLLRLLR